MKEEARVADRELNLLPEGVRFATRVPQIEHHVERARVPGTSLRPVALPLQVCSPSAQRSIAHSKASPAAQLNLCIAGPVVCCLILCVISTRSKQEVTRYVCG